MPAIPNDVSNGADAAPGTTNQRQKLEIEYVQVDRLLPHPMNANSTDIDPIVESIELNGFIDPILAQKSTGYIIDGWHRYTALIDLGATSVPVIWYDCDDATARRLLVAINRTSRLGTDDPGLTRDLMERIRQDDQRLLGTGWTPMAYESFLELLDAPYEPNVEDYDPVRQHSASGITCPNCGHEFGGGR